MITQSLTENLILFPSHWMKNSTYRTAQASPELRWLCQGPNRSESESKTKK